MKLKIEQLDVNWTSAQFFNEEPLTIYSFSDVFDGEADTASHAESEPSTVRDVPTEEVLSGIRASLRRGVRQRCVSTDSDIPRRRMGKVFSLEEVNLLKRSNI